MPDESQDSVPEPAPPDEMSPLRPPPRMPPRGMGGFIRRHWAVVALAVVVVLPALVFTIWAGVALTFSYSEGERVGYVRKISTRGWVCKTNEGELDMVNAPGSPAQIFTFSVRDDSVAAAITHTYGKRVALTYAQHTGVPSSCFGETEYFVTGVRVLDQ